MDLLYAVHLFFKYDTFLSEHKVSEVICITHKT